MEQKIHENLQRVPMVYIYIANNIIYSNKLQQKREIQKKPKLSNSQLSSIEEIRRIVPPIIQDSIITFMHYSYAAKFFNEQYYPTTIERSNNTIKSSIPFANLLPSTYISTITDMADTIE